MGVSEAGGGLDALSQIQTMITKAVDSIHAFYPPVQLVELFLPPDDEHLLQCLSEMASKVPSSV